MSRYQGLRVLFLALEFPDWGTAHHVSYSSQLSLEEGLHAQGVHVTTVPSPWFSRAKELCAGQKFDQVWIEVARHDVLEDSLLEWISTLAPVRVGFMVESLDYTDEEREVNPRFFTGVKDRVKHRLQFLTHIVSVDEHIVTDSELHSLPAFWWPQAVPQRFIRELPSFVPSLPGVFCGGLYGERKTWLEHPGLGGLLVHQPSPEKGTLWPHSFRGLHLATRGWWQGGRGGVGLVFPPYMAALRKVRRACFSRWLSGLQQGHAVVNLPSCVKAYAGRIVEGMAAGRPVLSWEIPNRPRNRALFEDGKEILLFSPADPEQLAAGLQRVLADAAYARSIAEKARAKVQAFHTTEHRVKQILDWLREGTEPRYG